MFLDISRIDGEGLTFDRAIELSHLEGPGAERIPVRGTRLTGEARPGKRGVDLTAHIETSVTLVCARCLDPFPLAIEADFRLTLVPVAPDPQAGETEMDEEDALLFHAPEGKADLRSMAKEQIYLNLPLKPICKEDCRGLCPTCGANRNHVECGCSSATVDERLTPLLEFKRRIRDS